MQELGCLTDCQTWACTKHPPAALCQYAKGLTSDWGVQIHLLLQMSQTFTLRWLRRLFSPKVGVSSDEGMEWRNGLSQA